jgi:hypothetical protein
MEIGFEPGLSVRNSWTDHLAKKSSERLGFFYGAPEPGRAMVRAGVAHGRGENCVCHVPVSIDCERISDLRAIVFVTPSLSLPG